MQTALYLEICDEEELSNLCLPLSCSSAHHSYHILSFACLTCSLLFCCSTYQSVFSLPPSPRPSPAIYRKPIPHCPADPDVGTRPPHTMVPANRFKHRKETCFRMTKALKCPNAVHYYRACCQNS